MAITRTRAADRELLRDRYAHAGERQSRNLEAILLLCASGVIAVGLLLVYQAKTADFHQLEPQIASKQVVNLNLLQNSEELLPHLRFLENPHDRIFAARHIYEFVRGRQIESVNDLRTIRISAGQIDKMRTLDTFASRLRDLRAQSRTRITPDVPLLTAAQLHLLRPSCVVRTPQQFRRLLKFHVPILFVGFYAVHLAWRALTFRGDMILLPLIHLLTGMGSLFMISLRDPLRGRPLFPDFALGVVLGCGILFLCSRPDYERSPLRRLAYIPLLGSFALSVLLLVFGSGPGASDARVNLSLGPLSVQPVEMIKILLVLFLAGYFANRWEFFRELKEPRPNLPEMLRRFNVPRLQYALPVVVGVALAICFFFWQRDLGPALVFASLFLALYGVARGRAVALLIGCATLVCAFWVGYQLKTPRMVAGRVGMWLSPWDNYVRPGGDHLAQSIWTFASGGVSGTGLGLGEAESVPAIHTDLILAAAGEELGFAGLVGIYVLYALLIHRALMISFAARGRYAFFLGLGLTLLTGLQIALISGGILGLVPLSGVVTPFLNYGKSSTVINFVMVGILAALSAHPGQPGSNEIFRRPVRWATGILAVFGILILLQAARIQVFRADQTLVAGTLVLQADGYRRYSYNPRILEAAEAIGRGTVFDRNGIALAASSLGPLEAQRQEYQRLGIALDKAVDPARSRHYPFGSLTFHLLGDVRTKLNWGAPNTSFVERDFNTHLQGYDDRARLVMVKDAAGGPERAELKRDFRELVPLVRYRHRPSHPDVQKILNRKRDLQLSIDIRLQKQAAKILEQHIRAAGKEKGAAVIIDPETGNLLASVTYPWPGSSEVELSAERLQVSDAPDTNDSLLDRPRFGLYPPGSAFKLITAAAALQTRGGVQQEIFSCQRLADGRVGILVRGWGRPIRDDILDTTPHGEVNMAKGIIVSCNAYFAQLGTYVVGSQRLLEVANLFGLRVASPNTAAKLQDALPQASYGQGQVVATPLQMARVVAAISSGGVFRITRVTAQGEAAAQQVIRPEDARLLADYMRRVVTEGTAQSVKHVSIPMAGKTGTAELRNHPSHAWFVGFAPYGGAAKKRIALAVIVENGRYGGRIAAPIAGEIVEAAARFKIIN